MLRVMPLQCIVGSPEGAVLGHLAVKGVIVIFGVD